MPCIDLHSHILPGVDDGPGTLAGSLDLARAAAASGTTEMVATPHVNRDRFIAPADIPGAVAELNRHVAAAGIDLTVHSGAEIALGRLGDLGDDELGGLGLGGGSYLLLESPFAPGAGEFEPLILDAQARGHRILLAHPERCPSFQRDPERLARLVEAGILVQVTAGALEGAFGSLARGFAIALLRAELVHVIASDAHDAVNRPPGLLRALAGVEGELPGIEARAAWLTEELPAAILAGDALPSAFRAAWSTR